VGVSLTKDLCIPDVKWVDLRGTIRDVDVLFIYGVGSGSMYRLQSSWLKKDSGRFLVFIEESEELFLSAKQMPLANDPNVRLIAPGSAREIYQQLAWEFVFLRFGYAVLDASHQERAQDFFVTLEHYHRGVDLLASDCEDRGLKVLGNALQNLSLLPQSKLGSALEGKCAGMPAIVCGAGPSLDATIPLLGELKDKALLIAGGSAIRALNGKGIDPHLSAGLDPSPPKTRFLEQDSFSSPFFYQGRYSHELLKRVQGPLIAMPDGGSYPLEGWMLGECGVLSERFEAGWTVANFCAAIAAHLGCTPIIFVGMDFSCGPNAIYASEIPGEENQASLIELEKGKLYSKKDWMMSAEWMGELAKKYPDTQWINATAQGLDIPGMARESFAEQAALHLELERDVTAAIHSLIAEAPCATVTVEQVAVVKEKLIESFQACLSLCNGMLKVWERHHPKSPLEIGEYAALEHDLNQQLCYVHFLLPLWSVWKWPMLRTTPHPLGAHLHRLLFFKNSLESHLTRMSL
jgi:hypothetical protein